MAIEEAKARKMALHDEGKGTQSVMDLRKVGSLNF